MLDDLINTQYAKTTPVMCVVGASIALSIVLVMSYCKFYRQKQKEVKLERRSNGKRHGGQSSSLQIQNSDPHQQGLLSTNAPTDYSGTVGSAGGGAPPRKIVREPQSSSFDDWGDSVQCYGIDLGSFSIKSHLFKDDKLMELPPKRSLCSLLDEGVVFGDVDIALDSAETSLFSLTRDLCDPDSTVIVGEVSMKPYQAIAGVFHAIVGDRSSMPPVAVCVPPYLQQVAQNLYLSAVAGNLNRFFIFAHSAALIAALLRSRQLQSKQSSKPPRNVVFVDLGRSGVAAYVCEVRDLSGSVRFQSFRCAGVQNMEARLVLELSSVLEEKDGTTMARVIEAAREIREDFASVPEYLIQSKKKSAIKIATSTGDVSLELGREIFDQICDLAQKDLQEVLEEVQQFLLSNPSHSAGNTAGDQTELVLVGKGFNQRRFRNVFEAHFERRFTTFEKVSVSQGLAVLGVMENPRYTGQRYDIYPLFQLPTVDEMGTRRPVDSQRKYSEFSTRSSSHLAKQRSKTPVEGPPKKN